MKLTSMRVMCNTISTSINPTTKGLVKFLFIRCQTAFDVAALSTSLVSRTTSEAMVPFSPSSFANVSWRRFSHSCKSSPVTLRNPPVKSVLLAFEIIKILVQKVSWCKRRNRDNTLLTNQQRASLESPVS